MTIRILAFALAAAAVLPHALGRTVVSLSGGGWTLDGEPVSVPHTWNAIDGADGGENPKGTFTSCRAVSYVRKAATYSRKLPDPTQGKRQFVKCEAVSIKATVRVNGREIGRHAGAFTAFCFEVTDVMKPSGNVLEIVADNTLDENVHPIVGDFTMYGGVYRDVFFIETDPVCIDCVTDGADGVVLDANPDTGEVIAHVSVLGGTNETQRFRFDSPRLWSPESPSMYSVHVTVRQKGCEDSIEVPFGFRKIAFDADGFKLNGVRRKLKGVCRHQDREGKGWAVSRQDEEDDVAMMKRMGADAVRTSHYPQSRNFLDACDRMGVMVWCETSLVNEITLSDEFRSNMLVQAREMVAQRRNHPSIVVWGLFNEIYSGSKRKKGEIEPYLREVRDYFHGADPSRKVVCASNQYGRKELSHVPDFCAFNVYPGWYDIRPWYFRRLDRDGAMMRELLERLRMTNALETVGLGEYGASGSIHRHNEPFNVLSYKERDCSEEYQAAFHYCNYGAIRDDAKVWGSFVWEMFDSGSDLQKEPHRHGINAKGLVEFDHKTPKDAFWFYKANWNPEPMLHLVGSRRSVTTNTVTTVMGFCNAGPVTLSVNGKRIGELAPDDRKAVIWDDVPLQPGKNVLVLSSGYLKASATVELISRAGRQMWPTVTPETKPAEESQIRPIGPYWRAKVALTNTLVRSFELADRPIEARLQFAGAATDVYLDGKKITHNGYFRNRTTWDVTPSMSPGCHELKLCNNSKAKWAQWVQGELFLRFRDGRTSTICLEDGLPGKLTGSNPVLPPYEGSIRLDYTDYRFPQREISASVEPSAVKGGEPLTFHFDFEGAHLPEFPFEAQLAYGCGDSTVWEERLVATRDMVTEHGGGKWTLSVKTKAPRYMALSDAQVCLKAFALYRAGGKKQYATVTVERTMSDREFPAPVAAVVTNVAGLAQIALNGKPAFVFAGGVSGNRPDFTRRHSDAPINVVTVGPCRRRSWWPAADRFDFDALDEGAETYARDVPGAYFAIDLSVYPPKNWQARHPDEMSTDEDGKICSCWKGAFSFSSEKALAAMEHAVESAIRHVESSPYANRVIAYRINSGDTIEWLGWRPDQRGKALDFSPAGRQGFAAWCATNAPEIAGTPVPRFAERTVCRGEDVFWEIREHPAVVAYHRYESDAIANAMIRLCRKAKSLVGGRKLVGTYYGYTMTLLSNCCEQSRGHFSLRKVIDSGAVDFLMSPQSYSIRYLGEPIGDMKPFATLAANGIVPLIEDDTRTSVGLMLPIGTEAQGQLQTLEQTIGVCRRNMGFALCRGQNPYFTALCSGTEFDFPQFAQDAAACRSVGERCLADGVRRQAKIAVVVSEESLKVMPVLRGFHGNSAESCLRYNRDGTIRTEDCSGAAIFYEGFCHVYKRLAALGTSVDYVMAEDLARHPGDYRLYVFTNAFLVDEDFRRTVEKLRARGAILLWMLAPGYMDDRGNSLASMKSLTGFSFEKIEGPQLASATMSDGRRMGTHNVPVSPLFRVMDRDAEVLGRWADGSTAVAAKGTDFFCGTFQTDSKFLRLLTQRAGVHVYSETGDPLEANERLVCLHAATAGQKTIRLPRKAAEVYDVFNRKVVARDVSGFSFDAPLHSSWLFSFH